MHFILQLIPFSLIFDYKTFCEIRVIFIGGERDEKDDICNFVGYNFI